MEPIIRSSAAEHLTFVAIERRYEDENIWPTQKMMAQLYDLDIRTINERIFKIHPK